MKWFTSRNLRRKGDSYPARTNRFLQRLESLEDRTVPSALTVNTLEKGAGSLRVAALDFTVTTKKTAGECQPPSQTLTGPASPGRSVCAPGVAGLFIVPQTVKGEMP